MVISEPRQRLGTVDFGVGQVDVDTCRAAVFELGQLRHRLLRFEMWSYGMSVLARIGWWRADSSLSTSGRTKEDERTAVHI